jgi:hypothetical protein
MPKKIDTSRIQPSIRSSIFVICLVIGILFILSVVEGLGFTPLAAAAHTWEVGQDPTTGATRRFIIKDSLGTSGELRRLVIDSTGKVGIGTTTPTSLLTVAGMIKTTGTGGVKFPDATTQSTRGVALTGDTMTGPLIISSNYTGLELDVTGTNYTHRALFVNHSGTGIAAHIVGKVRLTDNPAPIASDDYAGYGAMKKLDIEVSSLDDGMRVHGNVSDFGITLTNDQTGGEKWYIDSTGTGGKDGAGNLVFWAGGQSEATLYLRGGDVYLPSLVSFTTSTFRVYVDSTGMLYSPDSDIRLKKNIVSISDQMNVLESLKKLRGVYFNWNTSVEKVKDLGDKRQVGMIAQEVEPVIPEVVGKDNDGYKSVSYSELTAFLIEVCNEKQKEIDEQKKVNDGLKYRLDKLEGRLVPAANK